MTSTNPHDDPFAPQPEKFLILNDGRTLAYAETGISMSSTIVILLHGLFGIGGTDSPAAVFKERGVHYIAPTLPGFGLSDPRPKDKGTFAQTFCKDMSELLNHLHPDNQSELRIFIAGGSYGSVPAQILYGASFDVFPLGRQIVGCMILSPFTPFKYHTDYTKAMTRSNYFAVGPAHQWLPFLPNLIAKFIRTKVQTVESTDQLMQQVMWSKMDEKETQVFEDWKRRLGGDFERRMAENAHKSASKTLDGFIEVAPVLHSDWGFIPNQLDDEHTSRPIWIMPATQDELGLDMGPWLHENYKNSKLKWVEGGHIACIVTLHDIWREFIEEVEQQRG